MQVRGKYNICIYQRTQNNWEIKIISLIMLQLKILIRFQWISSKTIIITIKVYLNSSELYQVDYHIRFNIILSVFFLRISVLLKCNGEKHNPSCCRVIKKRFIMHSVSRHITKRS